MAITKPSDLFDFEKWKAELDKLESRKEKYTASVVQSNERIIKSYNDSIAKLKELGALMQSIGIKGSKGGSGSTIGAVGAEIERTTAAMTRMKAILDLMTSAEDIHVRSIAELKAGLKALETQYNNLDPTTSEFADDQKRIAEQVKQATLAVTAQSRALKVAKKAVDDADTSYNKLSKDTAKMKADLRAMAGAFDLTTGAINKHNTQAVILGKQIKINDAALKAADANMGNHQRNVGNYSSAIKGLGLNLRGALTTFFGVSSAFEALSQSLQIIDQFTRLRLGLDAVSASSQQVATRFDFISNLADKTGQDLSKLTDNYVSFTAATRSTALEGQAGDKIFKAFSNSFAALGKSSEVAERGLYAIQQMISKSKVSSEELNQQLAEALPGANKIFADALHVSTAELSNMLKQGKVLSADVLPKVAEALEKLYGERAQQNLKTIGGSFNRFTNQVYLLLDSLNKDKSVSNFFSGFNNGTANAIKGLRRLIETKGLLGAGADLLNGNGNIKKNADDQNLIDSFKSEDAAGRVARLNIQYQKLINAQKDLANAPSTFDFTGKYGKASKALERQKKLFEDLILAQKDLTAVEVAALYPKAKPAPGGDGSGGTGGGAGKDSKTRFQQLSADIDKLAKQIEDDLLADFNAGRELEPSDEVIEKWNKLYQQILAVSVATGNSVPSDIASLNNKLQKFPDDIAGQINIENVDSPTKDKVQKDVAIPIIGENLTELLDGHKKELDNFYRELSIGSFRGFTEESKSDLTDMLKNIQSLEMEVNLAITKDEEDNAKKRLKVAEDEFAYKKDLAKDELEMRRALLRAISDLTQEAGGAVFELLGQQNQAELDANQQRMEHELSLVKNNEDAQNKIKKEYAKKDLELRQKQAKLAKAEAAFKIAINTAVAVSSVSPVVPLMIIAAALGAIQLAVVLAKPIPQFFKGTKNAPAGLAQVGEKGPELRESKGKMFYYDKPQVANLERGDKIYTADETRQMLALNSNAMELSAIRGGSEATGQARADIMKYQVILMRNGGPAIDYNKMRDTFVDAMEAQPGSEVSFDEHGFAKYMTGKNSRVLSYNRRYSLG